MNLLLKGMIEPEPENKLSGICWQNRHPDIDKLALSWPYYVLKDR